VDLRFPEEYIKKFEPKTTPSHGLSDWFQASSFCRMDFFTNLLPFLTMSHLLQLRLVCKWLYNNTVLSFCEKWNINFATYEDESKVCGKYSLQRFDTSAKTDDCVEELFSLLVDGICHSQQSMPDD